MSGKIVRAALLDGRERIVNLLTELGERGDRDCVADVIEAVTTQLAVEHAALRALSARNVHTHVHAIEHARARFALFRFATAPRGSPAFRSAGDDLLDAFRDRPFALSLALSAQLEPTEQASLAEHLQHLVSGLAHPKRATREIARTLERCERTLSSMARLGAA
jgi:hypothetical protein